MSQSKKPFVPGSQLKPVDRRQKLIMASDFDVQNRAEQLLKLVEQKDIEKADGKRWPSCNRVSSTFPYSSKSLRTALQQTVNSVPPEILPLSLKRSKRVTSSNANKLKMCGWLRAEPQLHKVKTVDADLTGKTQNEQLDTMFRRLLFATEFRNRLFARALDDKETNMFQKLLVKRHNDGGKSSQSRAEKVFRLFAGLQSKDFEGAESTDGDDDVIDLGLPDMRTLGQNLEMLRGKLGASELGLFTQIMEQIDFQSAQVDFFQSAALNSASDLEECERKLAGVKAAQNQPQKLSTRPTMLQMTETNTARPQLRTEIAGTELEPQAPPIPPLPASLQQQ